MKLIGPVPKALWGVQAVIADLYDNVFDVLDGHEEVITPFKPTSGAMHHIHIRRRDNDNGSQPAARIALNELSCERSERGCSAMGGFCQECVVSPPTLNGWSGRRLDARTK